MKTIRFLRCLAVLAAFATLSAHAAPAEFDAQLSAIQNRWAVVNYQIESKDERAKAFETLAAQAHQFSQQYPQRAEPLIWEGIVLSTYAGAKGGLGALSLAKQSRNALESALKIEPNALQGSAYTSLGALYSKVPGFPLGFGDDDKARGLLHKALALNPDSVDSNYFYAEFLCDQHECDKAVPYLERAAHAAPRPGREVADAGRQQEVAQLMRKARGAG
jgi:tetratricopeptide (TPR) repeat protein